MERTTEGTCAEKTCFGAALIEKEGVDGLTPQDAEILFRLIGGKEAYPVEIFNPGGESSAMGFIEKGAAESLEYNYERGSAFDSAVGEVLADMELENEDCTYNFCGVRTWLGRDISLAAERWTV